MYSWIARNMLAKMLDFYRGTVTMHCLDGLENSQWWSRNDILELQNKRLRCLISHVYDNVPYYNRVFRDRTLRPQDIKETQDLVKLPELNKHLVRRNFADMKSRLIPVKEMLRTATSGSTGEPFIFYSTKEDQLNWGYARALRVKGWVGYNLGDKTVFLREARKHVLNEIKIIQSVRPFLERSLEIDPASMSMQNISCYIQKIEKFNPRFISGYPSAIYLLARFIKSQVKPGFRPIAVLADGEQLFDHHRGLIEEVFGCRVYNTYSSWEMYDIACECPEHNGLHIAAEDIILEIVDDSGTPVPAGKEGRILLTNLHNYAMPLIRYEIGDRGVLSDRDCPCGRGLPLLAAVNGRICDVIVTRSKGPVSGMSLPWDFLAEWGVEQFQIVQDDVDKLVIRVVITNAGSRQQVAELTQEIKRQYMPILGIDMDISLEQVNQILPTSSGKRKVVMSKIPDNI
jgi:phenylacetate-CoA ligase